MTQTKDPQDDKKEADLAADKETAAKVAKAAKATADAEKERQDLLAENARLQRENDALRTGDSVKVHNEYLNEVTAENDNDEVAVYVSSKDTIYEVEKGKKFIIGSVNGEDYKIPCDQQVMVKRPIAEALRPLIRKQQGVK